jgi:HlyD family secretion protein
LDKPDQTTPRAPRRRWLRWVVLGVLVAGAAVWFTRALWHGVEVAIVVPTRGIVVETLVSSGRVLAPSQANIASLVVGSVLRIDVREGQAVTRGESLVQLDDAEARAAVARAEATLAGVLAKRAALAKRLGPAAGEALKQARTNLQAAQADFERDTILEKGGALPPDDLRHTTTALTLARSKVRGAEVEARAVASEGSEAASLEALLADAQAVLGAAKVRLTQQVLTAPVDGVVLTRAVEVGSVVQPGLPLLVLAEAGPMRLVIEPDEKNLAALVVGQAAVASADAFPEQRFAARVSFIASGIDPSRGTVEVRLTLDSAQPQLRSDMTVSVEIELRRKADALTLPRAVVRDVASDAPWVMVVDGAHAKKQPVTLGLRGDAVVEVATGLTTDAQVIDPARTLPAIGARVRVAKPGGD